MWLIYFFCSPSLETSECVNVYTVLEEETGENTEFITRTNIALVPVSIIVWYRERRAVPVTRITPGLLQRVPLEVSLH